MKLDYMGSGKVYFNEQEYRCDLYINENQGGILIDINIKKALGSFLALPINIDFLVGELSTGFKFSLINSQRQGTKNLISEGRSVYSYYSKYLLKGVGGKDCKSIELIRTNFRVSNIIAWGNISAYKISDNFELSNNYDVKKEV